MEYLVGIGLAVPTFFADVTRILRRSVSARAASIDPLATCQGFFSTRKWGGH